MSSRSQTPHYHLSEATTEDSSVENSDIVQEQRYVSHLYRKLDTERDLAQRRLNTALKPTGSTPQEQAERNAATALYSERLGHLSSVEQGLCFGRLDFSVDDSNDTAEEPLYIGRLGLFDDDQDYTPLLVDWRAPVARPFYLATAAAPDGVQRRRHIRTLSRRVVGIDDEVLDLELAHTRDNAPHPSGQNLVGEAALLAALDRQRTHEMSDIVSTIQAEQDRIIRDDVSGVLVVQGGPGTGKTAVALHRAAYLLYTYRQQLANRGVLIVGPNTTFLRYIAQVLPSLGETGVVLRTPAQLFPGVNIVAEENREVAAIKGRETMPDLLSAAVENRQVPLTGDWHIQLDDHLLTVDYQQCLLARDRARATRRPHNLARRKFMNEMLDGITSAYLAQLEETVSAGVPDIPLAEDESPDGELLDAQDFLAVRGELKGDDRILAALDELWPILTPQRALAQLLTDVEYLNNAARSFLTAEEIQLLLRKDGHAWTAADIPLLDELAELLGEDNAEAEREQQQREREDRAYAEGVLHILEQDDELADEETLRVRDVLDVEMFAERQEARSALTVAERAGQDRTWVFGHVIVDEAQELSPMTWRMIMRRCPSKSMTVVGDVAQTSAPGGTTSWQDVLGPYVANRWRLRELTVNYRTPAEIMDVAAQVLNRIDDRLEAPRSVRTTGVHPQWTQISPSDLPHKVREIANAALSDSTVGTVAVITPERILASTTTALSREKLSHPNELSVLTVGEAKGLEFDAVIVVLPEEIATETSRGWNDLYVALTRSTRQLHLAHHNFSLPSE